MSQCRNCGADIPKPRYSLGETKLVGNMTVNTRLVYWDCPKCSFSESFILVNEKVSE